MLQGADITFGYREEVLKGLSFDADAGELLAVLGPNGAGKSTLLKIIVGILKPSHGSVVLDGRKLDSLSRREIACLVGYVPQESSVHFPLTALEFVLQGRFAQGRLVGFESDEDLREATRAMELTEATQFASRLVGELSGGERQRVMLARALAGRPRLLVLDEPVANLDISHQVKVLDLVQSLTKSRKMAAVVVTHELNLAAEFASRVLLLKAGEMLACGPASKVMTEPNLVALFDTGLIVDHSPASGAPRVTLIGRPERPS